jgi:hypothetical protein
MVLERSQAERTCCGSGDGSQQRSIVEQGHKNIIVTFFEPRSRVLELHPTAAGHLNYLEEQLGKDAVKFEIDATKLSTYSLPRFDVVTFFFPHTGVPNQQREEQLATNKELLR